MLICEANQLILILQSQFISVSHCSAHLSFTAHWFFMPDESGEKTKGQKALQLEQDVLDALNEYDRAYARAYRIVLDILKNYAISQWDIYPDTIKK